jgi:hypothetical protein
MEFKEDGNRITITPHESDQPDMELEELRRSQSKSLELERKISIIMEQLGIKDI